MYPYPPRTGSAYRAMLSASNRWARFAGAALDVWTEHAQHHPSVDSTLMEVRFDHANADLDRMPRLFNAVRRLQALDVARFLTEGDDPNERWDFDRGETIPAPSKIHGPSPLSVALNLSSHVYTRNPALPNGYSYLDVRWKEHELDAQAIIVGLLVTAGATVSDETVRQAIHQDSAALLSLVLPSWTSDEPLPTSSEHLSAHLRTWMPQEPSAHEQVFRHFLMQGHGVRHVAQKVQHFAKQGWNLNASLRGEIPLEVALKQPHSLLIGALIRAGATVERPDEVLLAVVRAANLDAWQACRDMGVALPLDDSLGLGMTLLHTAAANNASAMVPALIEAGYEVDAKDSAGRTALRYAAERGLVWCVDALLDVGADPFTVANDGLPLTEVVYRASLQAQNTDGVNHAQVLSRLETLALVRHTAMPTLPGHLEVAPDVRPRL